MTPREWAEQEIIKTFRDKYLTKIDRKLYIQSPEGTQIAITLTIPKTPVDVVSNDNEEIISKLMELV